MSINHLTTNEELDISAYSISVQGEFNYDNTEKQPDRVLELRRVDATYDEVFWSNLNIPGSGIYNNQIDLIIRDASYAAVTTDMYFDGFKYNAPSYAYLRNDNKELFITSTGWYVAMLTVASGTPETTAKFILTIDNEGLGGSFCSTYPSAVAFGTSLQYITASSTCLFFVGGENSLRLQIQPTVITSVISEASNLTIIKLPSP